MLTYIAGGGGAPACYIHMGILEDLIEKKITIKNQVGTSAGSIVGAFLATKLTKNGKIEKSDVDELVNKEFTGFKDSNLIGLIEFYLRKFLLNQTPVDKIGIYKGVGLHQTILELTENLKFKDLSDDMKLYITATEILTGNLIIFSKETTPNVLLGDAVRASCGIQGAFAPFGIELNDVYDGLFLGNSSKKQYSKSNDNCTFNPRNLLDMYGIKNNTKLFFIDGGNNGNCRTDIGANIMGDDEKMLAVTFTYNGTPEKLTQSNQLLGQSICIMMQATENLAIKYTLTKRPDTIIVHPKTLGVGTTDFELPIEKKKELLASGRSSIDSFF